MQGLPAILAAWTGGDRRSRSVRFRRKDESIGMGAWVFALVRLSSGSSRSSSRDRRSAGATTPRPRSRKRPARRSRCRSSRSNLPSIAVETGGSLTAKNAGTVDAQPRRQGHRPQDRGHRTGQHAIVSTSRSLKPGMYTAYCQIPGTKRPGMTAMLHVGIGGGDERRSSQTSGVGQRPAGRRA